MRYKKWLEFIQGSLREESIDNLKMGNARPPMPFQENKIKEFLQHTVWFLPNISSCNAMRNLLNKKIIYFFMIIK